MRTVFLQSLDLARIDMEACPMSYGVNGKPHALAGVSNAPDYISAENLAVTYTDFRKINTLTEGNKTYTLTYGVDDQRRKSVFTQGAATTTRYYLGDYEEVQKSDGTIQKIHYLRGGSMMLQQGATPKLERRRLHLHLLAQQPRLHRRRTPRRLPDHQYEWPCLRPPNRPILQPRPLCTSP
jgi:hypothetical protein